jgi:hypothetical protein
LRPKFLAFSSNSPVAGGTEPGFALPRPKAIGLLEGTVVMPLTRFQVSQLKKLLSGDVRLSVFCDNPEGEKLCFSGLVGIRANALRSTVTLTERGRAALAVHID